MATAEETNVADSAATHGSTVAPPVVRRWVRSTTMDNGGECVVRIDLVDGRCSSHEEAAELLQWFGLITRRLERQIAGHD